jgi:hypothetical protein
MYCRWSDVQATDNSSVVLLLICQSPNESKTRSLGTNAWHVCIFSWICTEWAPCIICHKFKLLMLSFSVSSVVATELKGRCRFYMISISLFYVLYEKKMETKEHVILNTYCHYSLSLVLWRVRLQATIIKRTYWDLCEK